MPNSEMKQQRLDVFPAFHKVSGRRVIVAGGGEEAAAKIRLLSETNAEITAIAPQLEDAAKAALEKAAGVHVAREFHADDAKGAVLLFAATGDLDADRFAVEAGRAAGVPSNAVDRPELCDFYTPALVNRAPIAVAVTSTGTAPVLARRTRAKLEALLPRSLGALARFADSFRAAVAIRFQNGLDRRRFWQGFLDNEGILKAIESGDEETARALAQDYFQEPERAGFVSLVGAGPGAEDLLTLRAQRALQEADIILHDALVPDGVIAMGRRDAERIPVGKRKGCHSKSQDEINRLIVKLAKDGARIVRLKSGDPMIFGRAAEEIHALREAGIAYEVVPGITAATAAASEIEIPLTLRGVASSLVFTTGHDFKGNALPDWARLAIGGSTVAVYMGRSVAATVGGRLMETGLSPETPVAVIENASQSDQRALVGTLSELPGLENRHDIKGATLVVIGEAVAAARLDRTEPLNLSAPSVQPVRPPLHEAAA